MTRAGMLVLMSFAASVPLAAQERESLITDRPDFTESSRAVGRRVVQIEGGLTRQWGDPLATLSGPELLLRIGVTERVELRAGAPDIGRATGDGVRDTYFGEVYAGVKWQIGPLGDTELAVMPGARIPIEHAGDESTQFNPELHFIYGRPIGSASLGAMTSLLSGEGGNGVRIQQTVVAGFPLGETIGSFVEYAGSYGASLPAEHLAHVGVSWQITPDLQVDLHGGRSLRGDAAPFLGAGVAVRLR